MSLLFGDVFGHFLAELSIDRQLRCST